jgi:DnaJ-class molecular chaperone
MKLFTHPALCDENTGAPIYLRVPVRKEVCPTCEGHGVHERQDIDMSLVVESMQEDGDIEGLERYYSGSFDGPCFTCGGNNVIDDFDWGYLESHYPAEHEAIEDYNSEAYESEMYSNAERRACGG